MEGDYQAAKFGGTADLLQKLEETFSADEIESFGKVNEGEVKRLPHVPGISPGSGGQ